MRTLITQINTNKKDFGYTKLKIGYAELKVRLIRLIREIRVQKKGTLFALVSKKAVSLQHDSDADHIVADACVHFLLGTVAFGLVGTTHQGKGAIVCFHAGGCRSVRGAFHLLQPSA